ncbi:MAG TPA: spore germination protein [Bacillota bacterium]|nr:spore germination protein [Bacillota bacterium]
MSRSRKHPQKPVKIKEIKEKQGKDEQETAEEQQAPWLNLSTDLATNERYLKETIGQSTDVVFREYTIQLQEPVRIMLIFIDGLIDKQIINEYILQAFTFESELEADWTKKYQADDLALYIRDRLLVINEVKAVCDFPTLMTFVMSGETAILIDGSSKALIANTRGWEHRSIDEPKTESVVRGPRVGFNEIIKTNTAQIRRWIRDPNLRIKTMQIGRRSKTDIAIAYIEGIVNPEIVNKVQERLGKIDIDGVIESSYIEEMIEDSPFSFFPTVQSTERADRVAAGLLQGRVAIVTDNTPFVLMVPVTFWSLYYAAEDYYHRWPLASLLRFIRFISFIISLYLPALFIALSTFSPELIPFKLAVAIAGSREGVPFPVFIEVFLMEMAIEVIREASVRLPGPLGQTIGIVGGFVLGDAAVRAGLISPIITVVVALTAISSFTAPSFAVAIATRLLRFPLMIIAAVGGLFGISMATILMVIHLASIRSFGTPYLAPITPFRPEDMKDTFFRVPWWDMNERPGMYRPLDRTRESASNMPWWQRILRPPHREDTHE